jgi:CBS domain-containing protein
LLRVTVGGRPGHARRIRHFPVAADAGRLVGVMSDRDVLKGLAATLPAIRSADPDTYR